MKVQQRFAIREWHESMIDLETKMSAFQEVTGSQTDSPLSSAIYHVAGQYIKALDAAYSIGGWLEWWWIDCELGNSPKHAKLPDEDKRLISSIDDLIQLLTDEIAMTPE